MVWSCGVSELVKVRIMGLCESEVSQYLLTFDKLSQNVIIYMEWYLFLH